MEEYLQDYTLSGILVLSAEGKILCGASQDGRVADPQVREQMEKELAGSIVLKVADHSEQVYAGRGSPQWCRPRRGYSPVRSSCKKDCSYVHILP